MTAIDWLLEGDPAIRWQVMADLTDAPAGEVAAERRYFDGEAEPCINGRTIETGAYFGVDVERVLAERLADGGWNCEAENGSVRSSFDTTINEPGDRWLLDRVPPGRVFFDLEGGVGTPSRWNTLRALRVLRWWDGEPRF